MILSVFAVPPLVTAAYYTSGLMLGDLSQGMAVPADDSVFGKHCSLQCMAQSSFAAFDVQLQRVCVGFASQQKKAKGSSGRQARQNQPPRYTVTYSVLSFCHQRCFLVDLCPL